MCILKEINVNFKRVFITSQVGFTNVLFVDGFNDKISRGFGTYIHFDVSAYLPWLNLSWPTLISEIRKIKQELHQENSAYS